MSDNKSIESHYEFGRNWDSFSKGLDERKIENAVGDLKAFLQADLAGLSFLDIGSGSGLSSLAALRLGAARVHAVDYDPFSVATSRATLERYAAGQAWVCEEGSVFDLTPATLGRYDIVYSWGVLHHTGDMWKAIESAAALVADGGMFAIALYDATPLCSFWRWEKRLYTHGPGWLRPPLETLYKGAYLAGLLATGRNPKRYIADYHRNRGMDWSHDVKDWLGGYPYESTTPAALKAFMAPRGFTLSHENLRPAPIAGLLGSPCNEFVFRKRGARSAALGGPHFRAISLDALPRQHHDRTS